jgi:hypothetical protein
MVTRSLLVIFTPVQWVLTSLFFEIAAYLMVKTVDARNLSKMLKTCLVILKSMEEPKQQWQAA